MHLNHDKYSQSAVQKALQGTNVYFIVWVETNLES